MGLGVCRKCGACNTSYQYHGPSRPPGWRGFLARLRAMGSGSFCDEHEYCAEEHLYFTCLECGYTWVRACADNMPPYVKEDKK